ncbi:hypothetical protein [Mycoplasma sp. VS1572C]
MSENSTKNKNSKKSKKALLTVIPLVGASVLPLAALSNTNSVDVEEGIKIFSPDVVIDAYKNQSEENRKKEYENIENINFGYSKPYDKIMNDTNAKRLVKFSKVPTEDEWNSDKQTWELIYENGTIDEQYYKYGTYWHNEYPFGQRTYGFALSNDLELVPGTLSIKMEYMLNEDDYRDAKDEVSRRQNMAMKISGSNPDLIPGEADNSIHNENEPKNLGTKLGLYLRLVDNKGNFDKSVDQEFNLNLNPEYKDSIDNFWVKSAKFDVENGSHRQGNWMYDWNNPSSPENSKITPWKINVVPEAADFGKERPAIDAIEYITTDAIHSNSYDGAFSPKQITDILSMTQIPDEMKKNGYERYFGVGLDTGIKTPATKGTPAFKESLKKKEDNSLFVENIGSAFLFHYYSGLYNNTYWSSAYKPIPLVTVKFQTRKRFTPSVMVDASDPNRDAIVNSFLSNDPQYKSSSFVAGLFHSDKQESDDDKFAFNKTKENTGIWDDKEFNNRYIDPATIGISDNQYTGAAISYATRTDNRSITINLSETMERYKDGYENYPEIKGFNIYQNGKEIDSIQIPWDSNKNKEIYRQSGYKTKINNFKLNMENLENMDGISLIPITDREGAFKFNILSMPFVFNEKTGVLSGSLTYSVSQEYKNKEELLDKLSKSKIDSDLLYNDEPLTNDQLFKIKAVIGLDFWRERFNGWSVPHVMYPNSTLHAKFWTDFIKKISKLNYDKKSLNNIDLSVLNNVNYRLSDNKEEIDQLLPKVREALKQDFNKLKMSINQSNGEIGFDTPLDNPITTDFQKIVDKFNTLVREMNGQAKYEELVADIDSKLAEFKKRNDLYKLARDLDNTQNSNLDINDQVAVVKNFEEIKKYLKDVITKDNLSDFKDTYEEYLNNVPGYVILEKFVGNAGNEENPEFKKLVKWLGYKDSYVGDKMSEQKAKEFKDSIINNYDINYLTNKLLEERREDPEFLKKLKDTMYFVKSYEEFKNLSHWYDLQNNRDLLPLNSPTFKYEINEDARSYVATQVNAIEKLESNGFKTDIYNFLKHKNEVSEQLSEKLNNILKERELSLAQVITNWQDKIFSDSVVNKQALSAGLNDLMESGIQPSLENFAISQDIGLLDALYSSQVANYLMANNKFAVVNSEALKQASAQNAEKISELITEYLEPIAGNNGFKQNNSIYNEENAANLATLVLKLKATLEEPYNAFKSILDTTKASNTVLSGEELATMFDANVYNDIFKLAVTKAKEEADKLKNIKNPQVISNFKNNLDKTVANFALTKDRLDNIKSPVFWENNATLKSDWDTKGNFFKLNDNLSAEESKKVLNDILTAKDANVDQYYYNELKTLQDLDKAIENFNKKVTESKLPQTVKESLKTLASNSSSIEQVKALDSKLDQVIKAYTDLSTKLENAKALKTKSETNIPYRFASEGPKQEFDTALTSLSGEKDTIDGTSITQASDLDNIINSSKELVGKIDKAIEKLDGQTNINNLVQKMKDAQLRAFSEEQKLDLENNLKNKDDLASATEAEASFETFNKTFVSADAINNAIEKTPIKSQQKYLDADEELKSAYDKSEAKLIDIAKNTTTKLAQLAQGADHAAPTWPDQLQALATQNQSDINKYKADLAALNGTEKLDSLKKELETKVNSEFNHVSKEIKKAFIEDIKAQNTVAKANEVFAKDKAVDDEYGKAAEKLAQLNDLVANTAQDNKFHALDGLEESATVTSVQSQAKTNFDAENKGSVNSPLAEVKKVTSAIETAINTINTKYEEFLKAKEAKVKEVKALPHLNEAQKAKLVEKINDKETYNNALLNDVVTNVNNLDAKMAELEAQFTRAGQVKNTNAYTYATNTPKEAFDNLFTPEATYLTNAANALSVDDVNTLVTKAKQVIDALDGDTEFAKLQKDAKDKIDELTNISEGQKEHFKNLVTKANNKDALDNLEKLAKQVDDKIKDATDKLAKAEETKASTNYTQADEQKQKEFDKAVKDLNDELNNLKANNAIEIANVTEALKPTEEKSNALDTATTALNGDSKLDSAKNTAKEAISKLNNLNEDVKSAFNTQIEQANSLESINTIKETATEQNTKAGELIQKAAQAKTLKENQDTVNIATEEQKQALENVLNDVNTNILDSNSKMKPNDFANNLELKAKALQDAMAAINKQIQDVKEARKEAINKLNDLTDLTSTQKQALINEINGANTLENIQELSTKANNLNTATKALKDVYNKALAVQTNENRYALATPNIKEAFDNAKLGVSKELAKELAEKSIEDINALAKDLRDKLYALDGEKNLSDNKKAAKEAIEKLPNLSQPQKDKLKETIQNENNNDTINKLKDKATELDTALANAKEALDNDASEKEKQNYKEAEQPKQEDLNGKDEALNNTVNDAKENTNLDTPELIESLVETLKEKTQDANTARGNLNGQDLLDKAKKDAEKTIDGLNNLSDPYKEALKGQAKDSQSIADLNNVLSKANDLDTKTGELKDKITALKAKEALPTYGGVSDGTKEKVTEALNEANKLLDSNLLKNPTTSEAIEQAKAKLDEAEKAIEKDLAALEALKKQKIADLSKYKNLSQAQISKLTDEINKANTSAKLDEIMKQAVLLDTDMKDLSDVVEKAKAVKATPKYTEATQDPKSKFTNATTEDELDKLSKEKQTSINPVDILQKGIDLNKLINALDGDRVLDEAKDAAKQEIAKLSHLDNEQKLDFNELLNDVQSVEKVNELKYTYKNIDDKIKEVEDKIKEAENAKAGINYTQADSEKQGDVDNSLKALKDKLENLKEASKTTPETYSEFVKPADDAMKTLDENIKKLNGTEKLNEAKKQANEAIDKLENLNDAYKAQVKAEVEKATTIAKVNELKEAASNNNTKAGQAIAKYNEGNSYKEDAEVKAIATEEQKQALNTALNDVKDNILDETNKMKPNELVAQIDNKVSAIQTAMDAIKEQIQAVKEARANAIKALDDLISLTPEQKSQLTSEINKANSIQDVNALSTKATQLNEATAKLNEVKATADQIQNTDNKYKLSDEAKRNTFDTAKQAATDAISAGLASKSVEDINNLAKGLQEAMDALNGEANLQKAKDDAKKEVDKNNNLSSEQKEAIKNAIQGTNDDKEVDKLKDAAKSLDDALAKAKKALETDTAAKETPKYTEADSTHKNNFESADTTLSTTYNSAKENNALTSADAINNLASDLNTKSDNADTNRNALNGDQLLNDAKGQADTKLGALEHLSAPYKEALKTLANQKNTIADVNKVVSDAEALNTATGTMKGDLASLTEKTSQPAYKGASDDTKAKVQAALSEANGLLSDSLLNNAVSKDAVEAADAKLTQALEALNSDLLDVDQLKQQANDDIDKLTHLSQAQKDALKAKVTAAHTKDEINGVKTTAKELDKAMDNLAQAVTEATNVKTTPNYTEASQQPKEAFDKVASQDNLNSLAKDKQTSIVPSEIASKASELNDARGNLDGQANLDAAKAEAKKAISSKENLEQNQKSPLVNELEDLNTVEDVNNVVSKANTLDKAIDDLKKSLANIDQAKKDEPTKYNYLNASENKTQALENAITKAQEGLENAKGVTSSANVDEMVNTLTSLNNALKQADTNIDGDANLAKAKEDAGTNLDNMQNLSPAHIAADKEAIKQLNLVSEVNNKVAEIQKLDTATKALTDELAKAENVKGSTDFNKATAEHQEALNTAIQNAKDILENNKLKANNNSEAAINDLKDKLAKALENVTNDIADINKAQKEAKEAIEKLPDLTATQKDALKGEVDTKVTKDDINNVVTKANTLDASTKALKDAITNGEGVDKEANNYKLADEDKQQDFNNAMQAAKEAKDAEFANKSAEELDKLAKDIKDASDALNGDTKLNDAKNEANNKIDELDNLTSEQKDKLHEEINKSNDNVKPGELANLAKTLDDAIKKAKETKAKNDKVVKTNKYLESDQQLKDTLDTDEKALETQLASAVAINDFSNQEAVKKVASNLNKQSDTVVKDINTLNGEGNLESAIDNAIDAINQLEHLSDDVKANFINQVKKAASSSDAEDIVTNATELNASAKALKDAISEVNTFNASKDAQFVPQDVKDQITSELAKANGFLDSNKLNSGHDKPATDAETKALKDLLQAAKEKVSELNAQKAQDKQSINGLTHLSQLQKDKLNKEIDEALDAEAAKEVVTKATELDGAMATLEPKVKSLQTIKDTKEYKFSNPENQDLVNALTEEAKLASLQKEAISTTDKSEVEKLVNDIQEATDKLNGETNFNNASETIEGLKHLNPKQRSKAFISLEKQKSFAELSKLVADATALDTAEGQLKAKIDGLSTLMQRFIKPGLFNDAHVSEFSDLINSIAVDKDGLQTELRAIENVLKSSEFNLEAVKNEISKSSSLQEAVEPEITATEAKAKEAVDFANIDQMFDAKIKAKAQSVADTLMKNNKNLYEILEVARTLENLKSQDELAKFKDNLQENLKASEAFAQTILGASDELDASTSKATDDEILAKVNHQLLKDELALAYDDAKKLESNPEWTSKVTPALQAALEVLKYANTDIENTKDYYDKEAEKLRWFTKANDLDQTVKLADQSENKSQELTSLLEEAKKAIETPNKVANNKLDELNDKIKDLIAKDILVKAIEDAEQFNNELKDANNGHSSKLRETVISNLDSALNEAKEIAKKDKQPSDVYNKEAEKLAQLIKESKKALEGPAKALKDAIKAAEALENKSNNLTSELESAKAMEENLENTNLADIENEVANLTHATKANDLDLAIQNAPSITEGEYKDRVLPETTNSQAVSNNKQATDEEIKAQLDKQLLNNAQINAINDVYDLNNLNKAQKDKYVSDVTAKTAAEDVKNENDNAKNLDKAMNTLKDTYNNVPSELKAKPIVSYDYLFSTPEQKDAFNKALKDASEVTPANGNVYKTNKADEITELNNDLDATLKALSGKEVAKTTKEAIDNKKAELEKAINKLNNNKLFNSPKSLQNKWNDNKDKAQEMLDLYSTNPTEFINKGGLDKTNELVNAAVEAAKEIEQFSDKEFLNQNNEKITQAQDFVNNNSEFLNETAKAKALEDFDKNETFTKANEVLNDAKDTNDNIKANIDLAKELVDAKLDKNRMNENVNDLLQPYADVVKDEKVKPLAKLDNIANVLNNNANSFAELLKQNATDSKFKANLQAEIDKANSLSNPSASEYSDLEAKANDKINSFKNDVNSFADAIKAITSNNNEGLKQAVLGLSNNMKEDKEFVSLLATNNFPEILDRSKNNSLTQSDLDVINKLKESPEFAKASNALQSLVNQDFQANNRELPWWPFALGASVILWFAGIISYIFKKK